MKRSVFLSYRRDDSRDAVGRICDLLQRAIGDENVFLDVDSIPLGFDFRRILREEVAQCHVFIAVVGPSWLTVADGAGRPRLEDQDDFVRIEIEAALERRTPLILLLVNGARRPDTKELPASLQRMLDGVSISLDPDKDFQSGVARLLEAVWTAPAPPARVLTARERSAETLRRVRNLTVAGGHSSDW